MPIATPEVYAEMLARAKEHSFAFPGDQLRRLGDRSTPRIKGFADAGSDGIIQFSTGGAEFGSGLGVKDMVDRRGGARRVRARRRRASTRSPSRCTPTTAPRTSSTPTCGRCWRSPQKRVADGRQPAVPVAHVGRLGGADRREPDDRQGTAEAGGRRQDHPRDRDRRRRRRGGRRRGRDQREALHHARRTSRRPSRRSAPASTASTCWPRRSATCTASTSRATSSSSPTSSTRARRWPPPSSDWPRAQSRSTSSSTAARAR